MKTKWLWLCVGISGSLAGCKSAGSDGARGAWGHAEADTSRCDTSGKSAERLDTNKDGRVDMIKLYRDGRLVCRITDMNFDGKMDFYRHFEGPEVVLEQGDLDFDGRIDLTNAYRGNALEWQALDTNYDGRPDIWKFFERGELARLERDSKYRGKVDYVEEYRSGKLLRIGTDNDGDGKIDTWVAPSEEDQMASGEKPRDAAGEAGSKARDNSATK